MFDYPIHSEQRDVSVVIAIVEITQQSAFGLSGCQFLLDPLMSLYSIFLLGYLNIYLKMH